MNKIISFIMVILVFASLLLSIVPLIFVSTYVLTGFSKESFIINLQEIPADRFWMIGIPMFIMCYVCVIYLLWKFFKLGANKPRLLISLLLEKKKVYRLEDDDIVNKFSGLISEVKTNDNK
jgi:hypothetical protein